VVFSKFKSFYRLIDVSLLILLVFKGMTQVLIDFSLLSADTVDHDSRVLFNKQYTKYTQY